jgi:hypothetical protein
VRGAESGALVVDTLTALEIASHLAADRRRRIRRHPRQPDWSAQPTIGIG